MKILHFIPLLGCLAACNANMVNTNSSFIKEEGMMWNTLYHITYQATESFNDSTIATLNKVGKSLSIFDNSSLVASVNSQDSTLVDSDFARVYNMSTRINQLSDGAFDPTISPLITAWGFGPGHKASADTLRIDSLMKFTGIRKTHLVDNLLIKDDIRTQFNFSAIAKGYGCDRVAEMFENNGIQNYLIEIGGEIRANGHNPDNGLWSVSIDKPIYSNSSIIHESQVIIQFSGLGLATSGNYRNYHSSGTQRYGHTISTKTGRPVQTDVLSASVLANSAMEADALATAFMAMGSMKAIQLNDKLHLPVMLITADSIWYSPEFQKLIVK